MTDPVKIVRITDRVWINPDDLIAVTAPRTSTDTSMLHLRNCPTPISVPLSTDEVAARLVRDASEVQAARRAELVAATRRHPSLWPTPWSRGDLDDGTFLVTGGSNRCVVSVVTRDDADDRPAVELGVDDVAELVDWLNKWLEPVAPHMLRVRS